MQFDIRSFTHSTKAGQPDPKSAVAVAIYVTMDMATTDELVQSQVEDASSRRIQEWERDLWASDDKDDVALRTLMVQERKGAVPFSELVTRRRFRRTTVREETPQEMFTRLLLTRTPESIVAEVMALAAAVPRRH